MEQPKVEEVVATKVPPMVMANGRAVQVDHVIGIDLSALESHKTILVQTTLGAHMLHDDVALDMARFFGLRPPAGEVASPERTQTPRSEPGTGANGAQPVASGGKRRKA